ncbi:MAG: hypothetical protein AB8G99_07620, partial [Planctomycetaceae bacterium]
LPLGCPVMFEQDNNSQADSATGESQPDVISEWKSAVQHFFSNEWGNLRDLIRRLEESDWDGISLEPPDGQPAPRPFHSTIGAEIAAAHRASSAHAAQARTMAEMVPQVPARQPTVAAQPAPESTPPRPSTTIENTRLADLAKRLESQLNRSGPDA